MAYLTPEDSIVIKNALIAFLEANLIDPYEQRTGNVRTNFVKGEDFDISPLGSPYLYIDLATFSIDKINTQSKTDFLEEESHNFIIYYYNAKNKRFTFADNGLTLTDDAQCVKYLQYVRDTLKSNLTDASFLNFHRVTFGTISRPAYNPKTQLFVGSIPITVRTYRR